MSVKKRKYSKDYQQYDFTDAMVNDQVVPQCVICFQILKHFLSSDLSKNCVPFFLRQLHVGQLCPNVLKMMLALDSF